MQLSCNIKGEHVFKLKFWLVIGSTITMSSLAMAGLSPGAKYYTGEVKIPLTPSSVCYVEVIYSADLTQLSVRSISTLPHLSSDGAQIWIALGPYVANFLPTRALYRYQDLTPGALVKDLVVQTADQHTPTKHSVLYWHAQAGHHDPVICDTLNEKTSPEDLQKVDEVFSEFDNLRP